MPVPGGPLLLLVAESFDPILDHPDGRWVRVFDQFGDDKALAVGRDVVRMSMREKTPAPPSTTLQNGTASSGGLPKSSVKPPPLGAVTISAHGFSRGKKK